jgi:hypothetical protein
MAQPDERWDLWLYTKANGNHAESGLHPHCNEGSVGRKGEDPSGRSEWQFGKVGLAHCHEAGDIWWSLADLGW